MIAFPPCKINLGLNIIAKRQDGYHNLETCFVPVPWTDVIEIIESPQTTFSSSGNIIPGNPDDNLCLKAFRLLKADFQLPEISIHLHKVIPTGAGLGGGSSDGAYTLRLLNEKFQLQLSAEKLMAYASRLGSDCAFFVQDAAMLGTGRGEILEPLSLNLSGKYITIVKPPVHVSTAEAYAGITPRQPIQSIRTIIETQTLHQWKDSLLNDFETSVFRKSPSIKDVKAQLYENGAVYASMSGSGSAVFGIFETPVTLSFPEDFTTWSGKL